MKRKLLLIFILTIFTMYSSLSFTASKRSTSKKTNRKKRSSSKKSKKKDYSIFTFVAEDGYLYEFNKKENRISKKNMYKGKLEKDKLIIIYEKNIEIEIDILGDVVGAIHELPKTKKGQKPKKEEKHLKNQKNNQLILI